jgi:heptosyltransferase-2
MLSMNLNTEIPKNIIVRMPNWLGDLVMATPVLKDIRNHWPKAKITAMCQSNVGALLKNDPHIDELFIFKRPSGWLHRQHYRDILTPLRHGNYDLGILLTNSFSSAWWFRLGNVKNRIGYADHWRSFLLDIAVPYPSNKKELHQVVIYKKLLEPLGIPVSDTLPEIYLSRDEKIEARSLLKSYGVEEKTKLIGVNPGAAYGSAKCWLPERFEEVTLRLLKDPDLFVVYFGDSAGVSLIKRICDKMPDRVINLAGKTNLRQLIALIERCQVFLTNDSGPMHIAAALKIPLLALFGSTSDVATGPYKTGTIIHKHVSCSPCYQRTCPIDFRCMKNISSDEVYRQLLSIMNKAGKS